MKLITSDRGQKDNWLQGRMWKERALTLVWNEEEKISNTSEFVHQQMEYKDFSFIIMLYLSSL